MLNYRSHRPGTTDDERIMPSPKDEPTSLSRKPSSDQREPAHPANVFYGPHRTAEERAAFVKQQAEQRMAERLAALGLKAPTKKGDEHELNKDRQVSQQDEKVRQAEVVDMRRDEERQRRPADQKAPIARKPLGKKPPPPPSRGIRSGSMPGEQKAQATRGPGTNVDTLKLQQEQQAAEKRGLE